MSFEEEIRRVDSVNQRLAAEQAAFAVEQAELQAREQARVPEVANALLQLGRQVATACAERNKPRIAMANCEKHIPWFGSPRFMIQPICFGWWLKNPGYSAKEYGLFVSDDGYISCIYRHRTSGRGAGDSPILRNESVA